MSNAKKDDKFSLKAVVNMKKRKVLFAEVDSAFADVLLSFLTLPLGTIVKILKKRSKDLDLHIGSLTSLYTGLANLDSDRFLTEGAKSVLLHPRSSSGDERQTLKLDISDYPPLEYFNCSKKCISYVGVRSMIMYYDVGYCVYCRQKMEKVVQSETRTVPCDDEVYLKKKTSSFLITDDLRIMPNSGLLQISSLLGDADLVEAETMTVSFGLSEVMDLLLYSLLSINPLSVAILSAKIEFTKATEFTTYASDNCMMGLKLIVQKSTSKLLYAEAEEDFVDFLFSFLVIPLGGVESLLWSNSYVKAIDNLHKSTTDLIREKYFKSSDTKNRLLKPNIPHGYKSKNHILPLTEDQLPIVNGSVNWLAPSTKFPKGQGSYLVGPRTYKVTDDLTVTPFCTLSILETLVKMKIPVSDVEELKLDIGTNKGLSILRASLTSKCALTDALLTPILKARQKKQKV
ncbi:uncharacterized protein LOC125188087 [Salvia hispanica]|uniref:uncharacterized protein LOC125188087 n=1 Tax=Salvia hispanica TaxID=49212 RepID=UPI00200993C9|nr:uncharacterized protein LOC125188087 [Salvia hispanica]